MQTANEWIRSNPEIPHFRISWNGDTANVRFNLAQLHQFMKANGETFEALTLSDVSRVLSGAY